MSKKDKKGTKSGWRGVVWGVWKPRFHKMFQAANYIIECNSKTLFSFVSRLFHSLISHPFFSLPTPSHSTTTSLNWEELHQRKWPCICSHPPDLTRYQTSLYQLLLWLQSAMLVCEDHPIVLLSSHPSSLRRLTSCFFLIWRRLLLLLHGPDSPCVSLPSNPIFVAIAGILSSSFNLDLNVIWIIIWQFCWCRYIYNDRTPFEKLTDKYFCPGKSFSPLLYFNLFPFHNNCSTYGEMGLICCFIITNSLR